MKRQETKMKKILLVVSICFLSFSVEAKENKKLSSNNDTQKINSQQKNEKKDILDKNKKVSSWSFFWNAFKFKDSEAPKIQFEWGVLAYSTEQENWSFTRIEPFVKLKWAILEKYLQPYLIFSLDSSRIDYDLADYKAGAYNISMRTRLTSVGNPSYGAGLQVFVIGWRRLHLYGYAQFQASSLSDATLESAMLTINKEEVDLYDQVVDHLDASYDIRRYECGGIISYSFFSWLHASAYVGYIWLDATIKINIDEELAEQIRFLTNNGPRNIVPNRLVIDESSAFGMLSLKFRIYKRLHINIEGTMVPSQHPIYYGSASFIIEGNK